MTITSPSNQFKHSAQLFCYESWRIPSSIYSYEANCLFTGEMQETFRVGSNNIASLFLQCEQQSHSLLVIAHVSKEFYLSPHFIQSLSEAFSSLDRVSSQPLNVCGIIIYDPTRHITVKAFNHLHSTHVREFKVYPLFPLETIPVISPPPDITLSFERVIGNNRQPYLFDDLQVTAESALNMASHFYRSILGL
ncbi:hypothetical protein MKX54_16290 [Alkalihalobacillus sp. FSL R5-0424]